MRATKPRKNTNMSPSQILKSAHAAAQRAGYTGTLKAFVYKSIDDECTKHNVVDAHDLPRDASPLSMACLLWLGRKKAARTQARQCARSARRGHNVVHTQQHTRSVEHCTGRGNIVFHGGQS